LRTSRKLTLRGDIQTYHMSLWVDKRIVTFSCSMCSNLS